MNNSLFSTEAEIIDWLRQKKIQYSSLLPHEQYGYVVNSVSSVDLSHLNLTHIPVKFHTINGNFNCSYNLLTNLDFCPDTVMGDFNCSHNHLTSLAVAPLVVAESFYCYHNRISTLREFKTNIGHNFNCTHNLIEDSVIDIDFEGKAYIGQNIGLDKYPSILNKNYREIIILKDMLKDNIQTNEIKNKHKTFKV